MYQTVPYWKNILQDIVAFTFVARLTVQLSTPLTEENFECHDTVFYDPTGTCCEKWNPVPPAGKRTRDQANLV